MYACYYFCNHWSLPTEHVRQAFISCNPEGKGSIPAASVDFVNLMNKIREFKMLAYVKNHLLSVSEFVGLEIC